MTEQDVEHVRLLSIFHYVHAALTALFGCFPLIHLGIGIFLLVAPPTAEEDVPPAFVGVIFIVIALLIIAMMWSAAIAMAMCGRRLGQHRGHMFCTVVAAIECMFVPIGTVLGVFTILVLQRPAVRDGFRS